MIKIALLASLLLLATFSAAADTVVADYKNMQISAAWEPVAGKTPQAPVFILLHGTLAHGRMEIIDGLQKLLKEKAFSSLAPTLSLNISKRVGMYPCEQNHTHLHSDAVDELKYWVDWLKKKGHTSVIVFGHSGGGNQVVWYANSQMDPVVKKLVLLAPATWNYAATLKNYQSEDKKSLTQIIAQAQKLADAKQQNTLIGPMRFLHCPKVKVSAEALLSYYGNDERKHTPGQLKKLTVPVLVIAGSKDTAAADLIPAVKPLANDKSIIVKVVDGTDHFFRDLYLEEVVELVKVFVQ